MKKNILNNKFKHHAWYLEKNMTKGEAMKILAGNDNIYLSQKPSRKQSDNLFDATLYDDILTDGRYSYRLSKEEKECYIYYKDFYKEIKSDVRKLFHDDFLSWKERDKYWEEIRKEYDKINYINITA